MMDEDVHISDHGRVEDTMQDDHIYKDSIFEVLKPPKPDSQSNSQPKALVMSSDITTHMCMAQRPTIELFSRRKGSRSIVLT